MRMRGMSDRPASLCTREQMTSQVRHPIHRLGSGKMTPLALAVCFGEAPAASATPPMASSAMNAPTATPPFRTLRRVAVPSCPLSVMRPPPPPRDADSLHDGPSGRQAAERNKVRTHAILDGCGSASAGRGSARGLSRGRGLREWQLSRVTGRDQGGRELGRARGLLERLLTARVERGLIDVEAAIARRGEEHLLQVGTELERPLHLHRL